MTPLRPWRRHVRTALALALGALVVASLVVLGAGMVLTVLGGDLADAPYFLMFMLLPASLGAVGLLLAVRRPENLVGWLLLVSGALAGLAFAGGEYVRIAEASGSLDRPLMLPAAWISNTWFVPAIGLLVVYLPLLYPTGHLPGPRWRIVAAIGVYGVIAGALGPATAPGALAEDGALANPLVPPEPLLGWIQVAAAVSNAIAPVVFLVAVGGLLVRFRRSRGVERQQIKWFLLAAAFAAAAFAVSLANVPPVSDVAWFVGLVSLGFLPLAIGVAILRYRLYEIDRLISRTVSYAVATALLGATFALTVLVLQTILAPLTGASQLSVAGSTLLVAALFQPLRRRVQGAADRRFNRARYDAEREAEAFAARVRDEVEVDHVAAALEAVLERTIEPASTAIWLRATAP